MVALDSPLTDEKLNAIGQVWARSIETAISVAGISDAQGRRLMNVLYNRARQDQAKTGSAMQFWKEFQNVEDLSLEVNLESKGVVGTCTAVWQANSALILFVVDGKIHPVMSRSSVRWWTQRSTPSADLMTQAREAVEDFNETLEEVRSTAAYTARDYIDAGPSGISSVVSAKWIVDHRDSLLGRTIEVRRSRNIHPSNSPFIRGVLEDAWFEYGSAQFVIGGDRCADSLEAECLLWEPNYCGMTLLARSAQRCGKLHNHRGGHLFARTN